MEKNNEIEEKSTAEERSLTTNENQSEVTNDDFSPSDLVDEGNANAAEASIHKSIDYSSFGKKEFVNLLKEIAAANDFNRAEEISKEIKPLFDSIRNQEREQALSRFKLEGGTEQDFDYKGDEWDDAFDIYVKSIRENKQRYFQKMEELKDTNLHAKKILLEKLRELVDGEDTEHSLRKFKEIQKEWRAIGQVPQNEIKTLWANYNALIDRYYDQRSIYFELKELDRKKNLELKNELVSKAEHLLTIENTNEAVKALNALHEEFRHVGPVPLEEKEKIWQAFKLASDAVYAKRDEKIAEILKELQSNLTEKEKINAEVSAFAEFSTDQIGEWNQKTKELLALQKKWESIGNVPRANTRAVNRNFWNAFKSFFNNKGIFFKKLDAERNANLLLKTELLNKAIALKDSQDWETASSELKSLQQQWREIGPIPEKQRKIVFEQFKEACDYFFEQRRSQISQAEKEQHDTLAKKEVIIAELLKIATDGNGTIEQVKELQTQFMNLGFVPKQDIASVRQRYNESLNKAIASLPISKNEKEDAVLGVQLESYKHSHQGDKKVHQKEFNLRRQITKAENDISVLQNNLEFFGRSKNAEKLKEEFGVKIKEATEALKQLKKQLQMVRES